MEVGRESPSLLATVLEITKAAVEHRFMIFK